MAAGGGQVQLLCRRRTHGGNGAGVPRTTPRGVPMRHRRADQRRHSHRRLSLPRTGRWELYARYRSAGKAFADDASQCGTVVRIR